MDQTPSEDQPEARTALWGWFIGFGVLFVLYLVLGRYDNFTELRPDHDNVLTFCFAVAGLSALLCGGAAILCSKKMPVSNRIGLAIAFVLLGFLCVFLVSNRVAEISEGLLDFPPSKTTSRQALLMISRAYHTEGKNPSWVIQPKTIWSNLDITEDDYHFMQTHRRVGDDGHDPDEISSVGYFCARVTLQQSGDAQRVIHAGAHKLPEGTVIICPPGSGE